MPMGLPSWFQQDGLNMAWITEPSDDAFNRHRSCLYHHGTNLCVQARVQGGSIPSTRQPGHTLLEAAHQNDQHQRVLNALYPLLPVLSLYTPRQRPPNVGIGGGLYPHLHKASTVEAVEHHAQAWSTTH